jgi:membrane peptidoglycan carboxypeptidase
MGEVRWLVSSTRFRTVVRIGARITLALIAVAMAGVVVFADSVPLPTDPNQPQASQIFFSDGHTLLARVGVDNRTDVTLSAIPLAVRQAVLAAEDRDFYHHFGISVKGVIRAAWSDATGGSEGASTITQQYVRNAYLTQNRTVSRKAQEMVLAIKLENRFSKDEILDRYLNEIYFGRGAYGIGAAAEAYFGVTVDRLTLAQGAVLASAIKDPWNFDPSVDPVGSRERWSWIVGSMAQLGWAPAGAATTLAYPPVLAESPVDTTVDGVNGLLVGLVEQDLVSHGISEQELHTAGLRIISTIDAHDQQMALGAIADGRHGLDPGIHAALVAEDPATGAIRAYYGGDQGNGYYDDATAPRRPASTFKPVTLAAGLTHGISYLSTWDGRAPRNFPDRDGVPLTNAHGQQCPRCPLDVAMVRSLNTPFYALAQRLGGATVRSMALSLGVPASYGRRPSLVDGPGDARPGYTRADISLGIYPVSPVDLAEVYATFASGGIRSERHVVAAVTDHSGAQLWYLAHPVRTQVLAPAVTADISAVLSEVVQDEHLDTGRPAAAKTGTQQWGDTADNQDAWMAGYTPELATVVWVGRPDPGPIRDAHGAPIEGQGLPAAIWRQFLVGALAGQPVQPFPPPAHLGRDLGDARPAGNPDAAAVQTGPAVPAGPSGGSPASPPSPPPPSSGPPASSGSTSSIGSSATPRPAASKSPSTAPKSPR